MNFHTTRSEKRGMLIITYQYFSSIDTKNSNILVKFFYFNVLNSSHIRYRKGKVRDKMS